MVRLDRMEYGNGQDMSERNEGRKGVSCLDDKEAGGGSAGVNGIVRK